ncbi:MAG: SDR family oxidoreductase [Rhizobiaceae bacterium]|nr:MAG: SDR family oxidoreductase [Rhizobiaceae bacterium]
MKGSFAGKRIIVTGAASGIGLACVRSLVDRDAVVGCLDHDGGALRALAAWSEERIVPFEVDITVSAEIDAAVSRFANDRGGIDGVINSAGIDLLAQVEETSDAEWRRIMAVNLDGPMHVCRAALPYLRRSGGGAIVNISSGAGLQPLLHRAAYSASKAALQMFSKSLAMEGAAFGVRVNCVCPGAVDTPLFRGSLDTADDPAAELEKVNARYALKRIAQPEEIAAAVLWLLGEEASYVTGTAMAVDGGRTFH